jgi:AAA15 family ATPase/GTPase
MRIRSIKLKNFKRFTDLSITDIPEEAKLVLVVGPNGSGKSSLFDAFLLWYRRSANFGIHSELPYFQKKIDEEFTWERAVEIETYDNIPVERVNLYLRSAYRNDPDFNVTGIGKQESPKDQLRFQRLIDNDQTVSLNYQRLVYETTSAVYLEENESKTAKQLKEELIGTIRNSMQAVFGDLNLNSISDPLGSGSFFFEKGTSKGYHYKNLSGGEKAAFDLLLDLHLKRAYHENSIYAIDEIETHLHTRVQSALLKEIVKIVPDQSQIWITSHSLGVLRAAQELSISNPGSVCIIDFHGVESDVPQNITPTSVGRIAWEKLLSVAIDDLAPVVAPRVLVLCEGSRTGKRRVNFDATIYDRIFANHFHDIHFVSGGNCQEVPKNAADVQAILRAVIPGTKIVPVIDRDDRSDAEVSDAEAIGVVVLSLRHIESYLLSNDTIEAFLHAFNSNTPIQDVLKEKEAIVKASISRGNPADDIKSAAGEICNMLKTKVNQPRLGNNTDTFLRDTMAGFVLPGSATYELLKSDLIDKLA